MTNELTLKSIWELDQNGSFDHLLDSIQHFQSRIPEINNPIQSTGNDFLFTQIFIAILAAIIIGFTFLPFGATPSSIQACQLNTDKKLLKTGGVLIILSTSLAAILFIQVLKLSQMISGV